MNTEFSLIQQKKINVSRNDILERLSDRYRWPIVYPWNQPSVEFILSDGSKLHRELFLDDGYLNSDYAVQLYQSGYTLLLSNVGSLFNDFLYVQNILNKTLSKNININLYAGEGSKSVSFPPHTHEYDVLVKNISGKSVWILDDQNPVLQNQDILFVPKFSRHAVTSIVGDKISLTCNLI